MTAHRRTLWLALGVCAASAPAFADEPIEPEPIEPERVVEEPVTSVTPAKAARVADEVIVVTGLRAPRALRDEPAAVTVIGRDQIA
ncbi:MAG: TonB-dependent receptor, partial [Myxococcales bacterium]|nr:TonB-dependent receptor [Myxococcales bacterium]